MQKKKMSGFWLAVLCIALIGCICCVGYVGWYMFSVYRGDAQYEDLKNEVSNGETESETPVFDGWRDGEEAVLPADAKTEKADNPINFDALTKINPELYAWVQIPDTKIDYPVAQSATDDAFYLSHDLYQEYLFAGCIYTELANKKDFSDPVTVLYGHNMRNGSMFQNLHLFEDAEFFEKNQYVYIYTAGHKRTYEIFAAYEMDNSHLLNTIDFKDKEVLQDYIDGIFTKSATVKNLREDRKPVITDKILTLSTCMGGRPSSRYVVQAVLVNDEETK